MNKKDKEGMIFSAVTLAIFGIIGVVKKIKENKDLQYKEIEISIPFGCRDLRGLSSLLHDASEKIDSSLYILKNSTSIKTEKPNDDDYYYDQDSKEENIDNLEEVEGKLKNLRIKMKDENHRIIPSKSEVSKFVKVVESEYRLINNLNRTIKELDSNLSDIKNYNSEYVKISKTVRDICKEYLKVYTASLSILNKFSTNKD